MQSDEQLTEFESWAEWYLYIYVDVFLLIACKG